MSWGSTQNTQQSNQATQSGGSSQTNTPNLPPWLQSAFQGFVGQGQNLSATAAQPVYGQAQNAAFLQGQNQAANQATSNLASTLASKGITNSGAMAQGATDIQANKLSNVSGFESQLPFLNQQATLQNEEGALNTGLNAAKAVPYGSTQTGTSSGQQQGSSDSQTTQTPGLASLLTSLGGAALGGLTGGMSGLGGLGGATGGGKGGGSTMGSTMTPGAANPLSTIMSAQPTGYQLPTADTAFGMPNYNNLSSIFGTVPMP